MNTEEKEIIRMLFDWLDSLGAGRVTFEIDSSLSDNDCNEILTVLVPNQDLLSFPIQPIL